MLYPQADDDSESQRNLTKNNGINVLELNKATVLYSDIFQ